MPALHSAERQSDRNNYREACCQILTIPEKFLASQKNLVYIYRHNYETMRSIFRCGLVKRIVKKKFVGFKIFILSFSHVLLARPSRTSFSHVLLARGTG